MKERKQALAKTTEQFIAEARKVHGDKYDYSKVEYVNMRTEVCIICPIHGEFTQRPENHLRGNRGKGCGCPICKPWRKRLTREEFERRVKEVHGDNLDVSQFDYKNVHTEGIVKCNRCGMTFSIQAQAIILRNSDGSLLGGCPVCDHLHRDAEYVYLALDDPHFPTRFKIGVTSNPQDRLITLKCRTPFRVFMKCCFKVGKVKARRLEYFLHNFYNFCNCGYESRKDFQGATEWFYYLQSKVGVKRVLKMLVKLVNARSYNRHYIKHKKPTFKRTLF
ncbi:GIY-YIG nuclease family protein [Escherichia coli]|uniref:GIY-YIG nuclease family protein n=1 Tax=Escherichia coli TaxID=562 RepID=UPI0006946311|nr:GIY-YIG nuclease family protein [Escherichia coli]